MTPENQKKHDQKKKRVFDAIALKEPDYIPITPSVELFHIFNAGYTVAEVVYDTTLEKLKNAAMKYMREFDPDANPGTGFIMAGEGPGMELMRPANMRWAGMPGKPIDDNSLQQYIEFPMLLDEEIEEYGADRTGWIFGKMLPRSSELLAPMAELAGSGGMESGRRLAAVFSKPEFKAMIHDLWAIEEFYQEHTKRAAAVTKELEELGYPTLRGGMAGVPFDSFSNGLRGTILSLSDLYENPELVESQIEEIFERTMAFIKASKGVNDGTFVFMPLHKGMDGFMSGDQYRKYYWRHLQQIILAIIDAGKVPYIYTEGKYNTRLDFLTEVPPGKVFYHFEDVDMAVAKKKLGGIACISGGFPTWLLDWGTPERVADEVKRLIDVCAPGGGYIFETSCGMDNCKRENVEVMFKTIREYGKA